MHIISSDPKNRKTSSGPGRAPRAGCSRGDVPAEGPADRLRGPRYYLRTAKAVDLVTASITVAALLAPGARPGPAGNGSTLRPESPPGGWKDLRSRARGRCCPHRNRKDRALSMTPATHFGRSACMKKEPFLYSTTPEKPDMPVLMRLIEDTNVARITRELAIAPPPPLRVFVLGLRPLRVLRSLRSKPLRSRSIHRLPAVRSPESALNLNRFRSRRRLCY